MSPTQKTYKAGQWVVLGTVLGAFIGLLFGKFALGLIFGFFFGIVVDSSKRKGAAGSQESDSNEEAKT